MGAPDKYNAEPAADAAEDNTTTKPAAADPDTAAPADAAQKQSEPESAQPQE